MSSSIPLLSKGPHIRLKPSHPLRSQHHPFNDSREYISLNYGYAVHFQIILLPSPLNSLPTNAMSTPHQNEDADSIPTLDAFQLMFNKATELDPTHLDDDELTSLVADRAETTLEANDFPINIRLAPETTALKEQALIAIIQKENNTIEWAEFLNAISFRKTQSVLTLHVPTLRMRTELSNTTLQIQKTTYQIPTFDPRSNLYFIILPLVPTISQAREITWFLAKHLGCKIYSIGQIKIRGIKTGRFKVRFASYSVPSGLLNPNSLVDGLYHRMIPITKNGTLHPQIFFHKDSNKADGTPRKRSAPSTSTVGMDIQN